MTQKRSDKIIGVGTRLAQQPLAKMGAYAAAKSALESRANTMAIELGLLGNSVNVVTPAFTLTDASSIMPEAYRESSANTAAAKTSLSRRSGGGHCFLAGDDASMLTGSHILITAGSHLQL
jgi:3-oxoacyl-[acyl-carrier protein] reductase